MMAHQRHQHHEATANKNLRHHIQNWLWAVWVWAGLLCCMPSFASADTVLQARLSYRKAYMLFKQKKWQAAQAEFRNTLRLLVKRHPTLTGRKKHFNTLGISDIYYHLALIALQRNNAMEACRRLHRLQNRLKSLPNDPQTGWRTWPINPLLPERFQDARSRFQQQCITLPSRLTIQGLPPEATIAVQKTAPGQPPQWQIVTQPVPLHSTQTRLRITAKGYLPKEINVTLPRWRSKTIQVTLKKRPKPRVIPRRLPPRRPPPPPPPRTSPWVWVGVGLGAAAVTAGVIVTTVLLIQPRRPDEVQGKLNPDVW